MMIRANLLELSAQEVVNRLNASPSSMACIDVRSEGEFAEGHIPGFQNVPILNNEERHLVGLTYKEKGQTAAIALGHELVSGVIRSKRIEKWKELIGDRHGVIACWRGGLRSKLASEWLREQGLPCMTVTGGYKALRKVLIDEVLRTRPMFVLSGFTGSGKTKLLKALNSPMLDIEGMAVHRGSCFGASISKTQPSQQSFENEMGLKLSGFKKSFVVEDESSRLGRLIIPPPFKEQIKKAPVVLLEASLRDRAHHIFSEYITEALENKITYLEIANFFLQNLKYIEKRLGGLRYKEIFDLIRSSFTLPPTFDNHQLWIEALLTEHYDPAYQFAFDRLERPVAFRGNFNECREWLDLNLNSEVVRAE